MNNVTLDIRTERAEMEIHTTPAKLNIHTPRPQFRMKTVRPAMRIERKTPTFKVDWAAVNTNSGLGMAPVLQLSRQFSYYAKGAVIKNIGDIATLGDRMMHTERNETIPELMREKAVTHQRPNLNISLTPHKKAALEWDKGHMEIEWSNAVLEIEWDVNAQGPVTQFEPHSVEVELRNRPKVRITVRMKEDKQKVDECV